MRSDTSQLATYSTTRSVQNSWQDLVIENTRPITGSKPTESDCLLLQSAPTLWPDYEANSEQACSCVVVINDISLSQRTGAVFHL